ncbi:MAG: class I SAM-dependent methyltransferase [Alphaproteobacteria bacterium]|nr:class I SAM-dependent methyltransferase [Alphaproteobacteria bacterium SS10]
MPTITCCRSCQSRNLFAVLDFGMTPLADRLVPEAQQGEADPVAPLALVACADCGLAQLSVTVPPDTLFRHDYPYYSSVSTTLAAHFKASADRLISELPKGPSTKVLEAASNDGYLLKHFKAAGMSVQGVDPAQGPADAARQVGIETIDGFFSDELVEQHQLEADLFLANNVLAHVPDINGFAGGIAKCLKPDGRAVIETPYLADLIQNLAFDTIYHQHVFHYSMTALRHLFGRHGLAINDCERLDVHGGSLRLFISRQGAESDRVLALVEEEATAEILTPAYYAGFNQRIEGLKDQLLQTLAGCKQREERVVGYGAAAKAVTLLAHFGLGSSDLAYIVDKNPVKHGWYMPGTRIPIQPVEALADDRPDYLLLLAWNFADEIMAQEAEFHRAGGRFIIPIPEFRIA